MWVTLGVFDGGVFELLIELPPKRGIGAQLARVLRAAAAGTLVPAQTLAHRVAVGVASSPLPEVRAVRPIRTIVVGVDDSQTAANALTISIAFAGSLGAALHVVSAHGALQTPSDAEVVLTSAAGSARAEGVEAVTYARHGDPVEILLAVVAEQEADLLIVGGRSIAHASRLIPGSVSDGVFRQARCSVLIVRTDQHQSAVPR